MPKDGALTQRKITDALKAAKRGEFTRRELWDGRGLYVRVSPESAVWYLKYRTEGGRQRHHKLGVFGSPPRAMNCDGARAAAEELRTEVRKGSDPSGRRAANRTRPTVEDLERKYLADHARARKAPESVRKDEGNFRVHVVPFLGPKTAVADIDAAQIEAMHLAITRKGSPGAANRCLSLVSKALNLAERWGWRPAGSNPCRHIERNKEKPQTRYIDVATEVRLHDLLTAMVEDEGTGRADWIAAVYLLSLIATGCRVSELLDARRGDFNPNERTLHIADPKNGEPRDVMLGQEAMSLLGLATRHPALDSAPLFGDPDDPSEFFGYSKVDYRWRSKVRPAVDGLEGFRMHDLRHLYGKAATEAGISEAMGVRLMGHKTAAMFHRYSHSGRNPQRDAVRKVEEDRAARREELRRSTLKGRK